MPDHLPDLDGLGDVLVFDPVLAGFGRGRLQARLTVGRDRSSDRDQPRRPSIKLVMVRLLGPVYRLIQGLKQGLQFFREVGLHAMFIQKGLLQSRYSAAF